MLLSLVIRMRALEPAAIPADQGRAMRALFMDLVNREDPALAGELHGEEGLKPYTVSDLQGKAVNRRGEAMITAGQELWWRVTSLSPQLSQLLEQAVAARLNQRSVEEPLEVDGLPFQVVKVDTREEEHPWAGKSSYEKLAQEHLLKTHQPPSLIQMEFNTPTAIHSHEKHVLFPLPEMVFDSWLNRWNALAPIGLPPETKTFAQENLAVSRYQLQTRAVRYGKIMYIGFVGRCSFRVLVDDPYWLRLVSALAAFAFFCGTGHHTTLGLGQTRRIDDAD